MKYITLLIFGWLTLIACHSNTQKKQPPVKKEDSTRVADDDCSSTNKYTDDERLKMYPFSEAEKILAVSYYGDGDLHPWKIIDGKKRRDTALTGLFVNNGTLNYSALNEIKKLNPHRINQLSDLLLNVKYKTPGDYTVDSAACFTPRNAFIFFDNKGKVFDYLEICFDCYGNTSSTGKITLGDICNQKYDLIQKFLSDAGIKFGITEQ